MPAVPIRHITVPVDGSSYADRALEMAVDLGHRYGAKIRLLVVQPPIPSAFAGAGYIPPNVWEGQAEYYRGVLAKGLERARALGVTNVEGDLLEGNVVESILDDVDRHPTDLVVVGPRGLGAGRRLILGSVTDALVHHLRIPVLVARTPPTTR
ncbi:MAG: universal stress protein [Thermoplasmata archaeon]